MNKTDDFISIHHYLKWYKFGFTRLFDNLSIEIRRRRMTREDAVQIMVDDEFTYNCGNLLLRASAQGYAPVEFHGVAGNDDEDGASDTADRCADGETAASPIRMLAADG